jgi:2-C-methyl-D-erythritol 4-phosphate cytidylyltransferase / 2-C-methyl-D-erythritol 2,4-cyclodiphosphate synthase
MKPTGTKQTVFAIIVAAGRGSRFGSHQPKQYADLNGISMLRRTLDVFIKHPSIDHVIPVIHSEDQALFKKAMNGIASEKLTSIQIGGATRQASVLLGLESIAHADHSDIVLIHDAARPFVSTALIDRAISAARVYGAAVPGLAVTDSLVSVVKNEREASVDRDGLRAVQTPQAFRLDLILDAHRAAKTRGDHSHTDDGSIVAARNHSVHIFEGEPVNMKITTKGDLATASLILSQTQQMISRTATGFDVHAFGEGDHVWLCGVKIPHTSGFIAHSDGDVALHAITDALFGAMADGDIGRHFPPSDMTWKGTPSDQFLAFAVERLRGRGGMIDLLDVTIICEMPKIGPHAEAMRQRIAKITSIPIESVSVKATTTERLGFTGRKEGISSIATATIRLPQ